MSELYKRFPPGGDQFRIPTSSREAALAGLSLYPACKPKAIWVLRIAWAAVELFGPRALPGRAERWQLPVTEEIWQQLRDLWGTRLGDFDTLAVCQRRQASRPGLAMLLLRCGVPLAFVKLRKRGMESLRDEARVQSAVWQFRPRSFSVPEPLMCGEIGGWEYFVTAPLPPRLHYPPADLELDGILRDIEGALAGLPRPPEVPDHWRPMHGDLTPWNLRQFGRTTLALIDWERAGWGPPGADRVLYLAADSALSGRAAAPSRAIEAIQFWMQRVARRPDSDTDHAFTLVLRERLRMMEARA